MVLVPEIKLIRTDTTLDLSQKAEKVCSKTSSKNLFFFFLKLVSGKKVFFKVNFLPGKISTSYVITTKSLWRNG